MLYTTSRSVKMGSRFDCINYINGNNYIKLVKINQLQYNHKVERLQTS